ncbi:MAG: DUF4185 domain-containing protein, partial [Myxococcota bacterium]
RFGCELLSEDTLEDPTDNHVQTRFNLLGSDLGVPVVVGDGLHLLFGDTVGYRLIWTWGEDPDSVGVVPLASVVADPTAVCRELAFYVTPDVPSVAASVDASIERDFAGVAMIAPPGESLADYIHDPAGPFPNLPGTFEVPAGAATLSTGATYVWYAGGVAFGPPIRMTVGYLARWDTAGIGPPTYQIVRPIDHLDAGELGGGFVQVSPVERDGWVYQFGTGDFRRDGVRLARVPTASIETGADTALYDPSGAAWVAPPGPVDPLFETDGVGELSVTAVDGWWIALYQRELHDPVTGAIVDNRVVVRLATAPEGPWSDAATVIDMADPAFQAAHCCVGATCPGDQILHCDRAGLYGAYLLPAITVTPTADGGATLALPFLASTWDPYDVVLFTTTVTAR